MYSINIDYMHSLYTNKLYLFNKLYIFVKLWLYIYIINSYTHVSLRFILFILH